MKSKTHIPKGPGLTLKKEERLSSQKAIDELFAQGKSLLAFPIKVVFKKTELPSKYPVQAAFTVSKKNFKRAVHRNRIKRLLRESYRINKTPLYDIMEEEQLAIFFIYIGKKLPKYSQVEHAMQKVIAKTVSKLENKKNNPEEISPGFL